ncbi:MAG: hypothetical protein HYT98_01860 [Candidatus Sungbacteria bacterium]|nr:hypothetical protein [Candidatus Sungbacteria bacterium]
MPTLTIDLPVKYFKKAQKQAHREGFKNPADWAHFLVARNIELEESSHLAPTRIISEMKKTGLYNSIFLRELKQSLEYADTTP